MEFPDSTIAPALQLFVWREICRHLELPESAATVAELFHRELGLQGLRIDRVHPTSVDTLYSSHRFLSSPPDHELSYFDDILGSIDPIDMKFIFMDSLCNVVLSYDFCGIFTLGLISYIFGMKIFT